MTSPTKGYTYRRTTAHSPAPDVAPLPGQSHARPRAERAAAGKALRDAKIKLMVEIMKPFNHAGHATACGSALARAHDRSGDAAMCSGFTGIGEAFEDAMSAFALACPDQFERDHEALTAAVRSRRIEARADV